MLSCINKENIERVVVAACSPEFQEHMLRGIEKGRAERALAFYGEYQGAVLREAISEFFYPNGLRVLKHDPAIGRHKIFGLDVNDSVRE